MNSRSRIRGVLLAAVLGAGWLGAGLEGQAQELPLLSITNAWRYDATTEDYGSAWKETAYDDSGWPGPSPALLYNDNNPGFPAPTNTVVPLVYNSRRIISYYYRTRFNFPTNPAGVILIASNLIDDGAVFWLNGREAGRLRMTNEVVVRDTLATGFPPGPQGDATIFEVLTLTNHLVEGTNVLAVEVHQNSPASPDTAFGMSLTALLPYLILTDDSQLTNRTVQQGRSTTLMVAADGMPAPAFQWFLNGTSVAGATGAVYTITRMAPEHAGSYFCRVTNAGGTTNSRTAEILFEADLESPTLVSAVLDRAATNLVISFSEPMDPRTATDPFNYWLYLYDGTLLPDVFTNELVLVNGSNVVTATAGLIPGEYYRLEVIGIMDTQSNPIADLASIAVSVRGVSGDQQGWRYHQAGADPGPAWPEPGFNDTTNPDWLSGVAAFYATAGVPAGNVPLRTPLALTNPPGAPQFTTTYYFRTHFVSTGYVGRLQLRALVDDGAVFYVNGQEAWRVGMPPAPTPITYGTYATRTVTDPEVRYAGPVDIPATNVVDGDNVLAVEVHQSAAGTPDAYFAAELLATGSATPLSRVWPLPAVSGRTFLVRWAPETGGGEGIAGFDVYVSTDGLGFTPWLVSTPVTSAVFTGEAGRTYSFYSVARNAMGLEEAPPATADAQTTVSADGPLLAPVADQTAQADEMLVLTNEVSGVPVGAYEYHLGAGAPAGARINRTNGVFRWTPTCFQGGTTNEITVWVTDGGAPNLSDATTFTVTVADCAEAGLGRIPLYAGERGQVPLSLFSSTSLTGLSVVVSFPAGRLTDFDLTNTMAEICSNDVQVLDETTFVITLATCPGQSLQGLQELGSLEVTAVTNSTSAFVFLFIGETRAGTADGRTLLRPGTRQPGRVAVVAQEPLLEAWRSAARQSMLTVYGQEGTNYLLEWAGSLAGPGLWQTGTQVTLTNIAQPLEVQAGTNATLFYRAREQ